MILIEMILSQLESDQNKIYIIISYLRLIISYEDNHRA